MPLPLPSRPGSKLAASNAALGLLPLLAACVAPEWHEGHWQGACAGGSFWEATVAMDLERIDDEQSVGAATVDRGYGPEAGTARLLLEQDEVPSEGAAIVVEGDDASWQMWQHVYYRFEDDAYGWSGSCWLSDDGVFRVATDCGWGGCDYEDVVWSGSTGEMDAFVAALDYGERTGVLLTRDESPLDPVVLPEPEEEEEDTGDDTEPEIDPDDYVEFEEVWGFLHVRCDSTTAEASDRDGALTLSCSDGVGEGPSGGEVTLTAPGVGSFDGCDPGVKLTIDYGTGRMDTDCIGGSSVPYLAVEITERTEDPEAGTALWAGSVEWYEGGTLSGTGRFRVPVAVE